MARRKKHKKTHRRRRVGGFADNGIVGGLMAVGAGLGGVILTRVVNNMMTSVSGTLIGAAEVGLGAYGAAKFKNNKVAASFLMGVGVAGGWNVLGAKGFGLLPAAIGYGPNPMHAVSRMAGYRDVPKIGFPKPSAIGAGADRRRMARMYAGVYG